MTDKKLLDALINKCKDVKTFKIEKWTDSDDVSQFLKNSTKIPAKLI